MRDADERTVTENYRNMAVANIAEVGSLLDDHGMGVVPVMQKQEETRMHELQAAVVVWLDSLESDNMLAEAD